MFFRIFIILNKNIFVEKYLNFRCELSYFGSEGICGVAYYIILCYICGVWNGRGGNDVPSFFYLHRLVIIDKK